jgi:hypothetical protein
MSEDTPDLRSLAAAGALQASYAVTELLQISREGPLGAYSIWDDDPIAKLADATKLAIEAQLAAGEEIGSDTNQLLGALERFLDGVIV